MQEIFDVIIIGGGPSGIMAAGQAGREGSRVLLLEKNNRLGKKLLLTGNERCNITQAKFNVRELVKSYGEDGRFLFSAFSSFGSKDTMKFFERLGVSLKVEPNGRVFPKSDSAKEVVNALEKFLDTAGVETRLEANVKKIKTLSKDGWEVELANGEQFRTKNLVIATGGLSYPHTGSTGAGFDWARAFGHKIVDTMPVLVPIKVKEKWIERLRGVSLKDAVLIAKHGQKEIVKERGQILFTHFGLSGPAVLNASKKMVSARRAGAVEILINFFPELTKTELDKKLQNEFKKEGSKLLKNVLDTALPRALAEILLEMAKVKIGRKAGEVTKTERIKIVELVSSFKLNMEGDLGYAVAMVTGGGVDLKEIDQKTMRSKIHNNLYFTGEILNIDGPTGGYNLQIAWSTGFVAGTFV